MTKNWYVNICRLAWLDLSDICVSVSCFVFWRKQPKSPGNCNGELQAANLIHFEKFEKDVKEEMILMMTDPMVTIGDAVFPELRGHLCEGARIWW